MPDHVFARPRGEIEVISIASEALADNLLGDPGERSVSVYLPEGYRDSGEDYPLLVDLVGFTGSGFSHTGWKPYWESVPQRVDRLVAGGAMGPVIVALPDCFTSLGGNQYINSEAMGRWADFLVGDMLDALEERFRIRPGREHRGVFGKSSGGYGAIIHGMRYADTWGAIACHSGDMGFDRLFLGDFPKTVNALAKHGGIEGFLAHVSGCDKIKGEDLHHLMVLAMGATYDPDPKGPKGIRLPVDLRTCALIEARWSRWLAHDPVHLIEDPTCQENLRTLRGLYIDCGSSDQYHIHFGTRQLADRLAELHIAHNYDEFDDNHSGVDYRMDLSLPFLYSALSDGV